MRLVVALLALVWTGCGGGDGHEGIPTDPGGVDSRYAISGVRAWYLVGNDLTPGHDTIEVSVTPPEGIDRIDAWLGLDGPIALTESGGVFTASIDIASLEAGTYPLLLQAESHHTAFARLDVRRSHPLYVQVGNDWDDADNHPNALQLQDELHAEHPALKMTHFVGPYTFTDPTVTTERRAELVAWVKGWAEAKGDEIGLHIHPYCNFVDTTSVTCRHMPSTVYANGDTTGYTVMVAAYTEEEFTTLLEESDALFVANGLPKPTSFRAGGWTAGPTTLLGLANAGYVADTSALNWERLEEWEGVQNGVLYEWNKTQWSNIDELSQPYYPSADDVQMPGDIPVLEVPDNGILVDYVSTAEIIEMFEANWPDRAPLTEPRVYTTGYHPSNFNIGYKTTLGDGLSHIDQFLAENDAGPVVYETLSNMARVWKPD